MTSDESTEQAIIAAGASTAPRVTPDDIEDYIASEHYFTAEDGARARPGLCKFKSDVEVPGELDRLGLLTFCVLVLKNGSTVTGESACVSAENSSAQIGRDIARQNAEAKVRPLMGCALKEPLSK